MSCLRRVGLPKENPGSTTTDAYGSATFNVVDPTLTYRNPETGRVFPRADCATYAEAHALQETAAPNPYNPYAINGAWTRAFDSYWSAFSSATDEVTGQDHDRLDLASASVPEPAMLSPLVLPVLLLKRRSR